MKPANVTVFELFQKHQRYVVPLFQRQYVWQLDKHWKPLWEDIEIKSHQILTQRLGSQQEISNHFMGAIVLTNIKVSGLQVWAKSIIDGQQRLTTLQIILFALRDIATRLGCKDDLPLLEMHIANYCRTENAIEKYKVWPTQADQEIFENIYNAGSIDALNQKYPLVYERYQRSPKRLPLLVEAYKYFYSSMYTFITEPLDDGLQWPEGISYPTQEEKINAIITAFKNHLEIVTIDLDENDDPQMIFETLNFRGEPLKPSDLIRNFVFLEASQKKLPIKDLYDKYWYEFDKPASNGNAGFWKQEESVGRNRIQHLDLFIYHYLTYITEREIQQTQTFSEFKLYWATLNGDSEAELAKLVQFGKIFERFYRSEYKTRLDIFLRRLRQLDITTLYPIFLYLKGERTDITEVELEKWITVFESYLIRRLVCNLNTRGYNNVFRIVLDELRKKDHPGVESLIELLKGYTTDSNRFPDDKEFGDKWMVTDMYHKRGHKTVLEAIDLQLTTSKQESVHIDSALSTEHILPQGWNENNWPLPAAHEGESHEAQVIRRNGLLHTLGNLTLLTSALNSSVSNGPFKDKRPQIAGQSRLNMNTYFQEYGDTWTEEDILKRGKELFKTALKIWPYPKID